MTRTFLLAVAAGALMGIPSAAPAQGPTRGNQIGARERVTAAFTSGEREAILDYYKSHVHEGRPLPPGIARNLARGKPLPPGIAKQSLPADLRQVVPVRDGVEITIFGDRIVLLEASGIVVDILEGVFKAGIRTP